jgi:signal transduction histidine kinase
VRGGLTSRTVVASGALAATVTASFALSLVAIATLRDRERQVTGSLERLQAATELERRVIDLETGVRGFVLTHEERFLEPWDGARADLPDRGEALARLSDSQLPLVTQITADIQSYIDEYGVPLVEAVRRDDPAASSVPTTDEGRRRVDEIRAEIDRYRATEDAQLERGRDRSHEAARLAVITAAGGLVGSLLLIALFAGYLSRAIVAPLRRASATAGRLATGDLAARLPEAATGEIGSLDRSFNSMAASLEANRDELTHLLDEQAALRRVATLVARGRPPSEIVSAVADEVTRLIGARRGGVIRFEPDGAATTLAGVGQTLEHTRVGVRWRAEDYPAVGAVWRTGRSARVDEKDFGKVSSPVAKELRRAGVASVVASPIIVDDRVWGTIAVASHQEPLPADTEKRMVDFGELVATAIANAENRAELNASRARVVAASDETRRRIERDLHDGAQQRLVSIGLELRAAQSMVPAGLPDLSGRVSRVAQALNAAVADLQETSRGIHPAILSRGGLGPALRTLARRSALPVELDLGDDQRLPERVEVAVYYVTSEALTNAVKHAHASVIHIDLHVDGATVELSIRDDGVGGADPTRGSGLVGLRDRIEALGGKIEVVSPSGRGTSLAVRIPVGQS